MPTGGKCGTICVKDLNSSILTPKVLVEKWIMPSWWEIATPPINTKERIWRDITDEEKYIYISEENGQYTVERNSDVLFARAVARKFEDYKVREQIVAGNIIVSLSPTPTLPVGHLVARCANSIRYVLHLGKPVRISWWGRKSAPGWVMQGKPSKLNYVLSGKWEKTRFNQKAKFSEHNTKVVPIETVSWPDGNTFSVDGWWKGFFNQRIYKP